MKMNRRRFMTRSTVAAGLATVFSGSGVLSFEAETGGPDHTAQDESKEAGPDTALLVGIAAEDITCQLGLSLAGFAARTSSSNYVRSRLYTRVLYLKSESETLLWIVCDLLSFSRETVEHIKREVSEASGIEPDRIMVMTTHTHSGPSVKFEGAHKDYIEETLYPGILKATGAAIASVEPCRMVEATGTVDIAVDRRKKATRHTEKRVPAVAWKRPDGSFKAVLVGYTMHPVCYRTGDISAEWPGAVADAIQEAFSPETGPIVVQGACGNVNCPRINIPDEEMKQLGREIVDSVAETLKTAEPVPSYFAVRTRHLAVLLDYPGLAELDEFLRLQRKKFSYSQGILATIDRWENWARAYVDKGGPDFIDAETTAVVLGHRVFLGFPFEAFSWMNPELAKHTSLDCFAMGYANGCHNYLSHDAAYDEGGYCPDEAHLWYRNFRCKRGELERLAESAALLAEYAAVVAGLGKSR